MSEEEDRPSIWVEVPNGRVLLFRQWVPAASITNGGYWRWIVAAQTLAKEGAN